ncbi:MAG: hypothetical protein DAHOPDDO_00608 [Ignavibacteriaceae bacterium]|nr:hypothetical protein [Ignavibacteriaceae bacterium]
MRNNQNFFSDIEVAKQFSEKNKLLKYFTGRKSFFKYGTEPENLYWKEMTDDQIRKELYQFCRVNDFDLSNINRVDSALKALKLHLQEDEKFNDNKYHINLINVIYDAKANQTIKKSPEYLNTVQFPIQFDENAVCPLFDKFLDEILPNKEIQDYVLKIMGYILLHTLELERVFLFTGAAGSGKSTLVSVIQNLLGVGNYSNILIHQLANANNKFIESELIDKYLNVSTEMSANALSQEFIKAYSGGDFRTCDRKWISAATYKPTAKLLMLANELPELNEIGNSIISRYVIVNFPNQFRGTANEDTGLKSKLAAELPGIFNRIRAQYQYMFKDGSVYFEMPEILKKQTTLMLEDMNSVSSFIQDECELLDGKKVTLKSLRSRYNAYCKNMVYQSLKLNQLKAGLTDFYNLKIIKSTGNLLYVYGISLK